MNDFQVSDHTLQTQTGSRLARESNHWAYSKSKARTPIMEISKCVAV
jgi:hypothetical protein